MANALEGKSANEFIRVPGEFCSASMLPRRAAEEPGHGTRS
jgi:hypothetical protein